MQHQQPFCMQELLKWSLCWSQRESHWTYTSPQSSEFHAPKLPKHMHDRNVHVTAPETEIGRTLLQLFEHPSFQCTSKAEWVCVCISGDDPQCGLFGSPCSFDYCFQRQSIIERFWVIEVKLTRTAFNTCHLRCELHRLQNSVVNDGRNMVWIWCHSTYSMSCQSYTPRLKWCQAVQAASLDVWRPRPIPIAKDPLDVRWIGPSEDLTSVWALWQWVCRITLVISYIGNFLKGGLPQNKGFQY